MKIIISPPCLLYSPIRFKLGYELLLMKPAAFVIACFFGLSVKGQLIIRDIFGRDLSGQSIKLVDWEGYMANPAIQLSLQAPNTASFPITVTLSANGSRLYFNMPSVVGNAGPSKSITLSNTTPVNFYLSIFPDRQDGDENYMLTINSNLGIQSIPILVIDEDAASPVVDYPVFLDFSKDNPAYNFFAGQTKRNIVRQAADDWAYFINNMHFDVVPANTEYTFIWNDLFTSGNWVLNANPYSGFLLYAYGAHDALHRSGGAPSLNAFQTINGSATGLRRSGGYNVDPHGNYNTLGWDTTITDNTWFLGTNTGSVPNDLYSIALHEMGHSFCFNPGYPVFQGFKNSGNVTDPDVLAYQGGSVPIDGSDHLSNGATNVTQFLVDRISKRGCFGSEYAGVMPSGRWLITKLNLLCLKAIGYNVKQTSAFRDPIITTVALSNGQMNQTYSEAVTAQGGIPFYKYEVFSGSIPSGLTLNSFTGILSGTPLQGGNFSFTIRVTDYDNKFFDRSFSMTIASVFTFTGNGDWNLASNWVNDLIAPVPIPSTAEVIIDHLPGGECKFIGNFIIQPGAKLKIQPGKTLNIRPM